LSQRISQFWHKVLIRSNVLIWYLILDSFEVLHWFPKRHSLALSGFFIYLCACQQTDIPCTFYSLTLPVCIILFYTLSFTINLKWAWLLIYLLSGVNVMLQVSGLKSITSKHLALASQVIGFVHAIIPGRLIDWDAGTSAS
jgi:hypothetical protein